MLDAMNLGTLAAMLQGELSDPGRAGVVVSGFRALEAAGPGDLAFLWDAKYVAQARESRAAAIVTVQPIEGAHAPFILVRDAEAAMLALLGKLYDHQHPRLRPGVHPSAYVAASARLGEGVAVGPCAVVEEGARLGDGTQVWGGAYVGRGVTTGQGCQVHPNATLLDHCTLGDRVVVWSGAVVGKDGFGFRQRQGRHVRIPQVGSVVLDDDVEVGALTTVARGALEDTRVREGTKIDDHCHVAHNCDLGRHVILIGYSRMGGSVKIGDHAALLQDARVGVGLSVGERTVVGSGAAVKYESVGPDERVMGDPATHHIAHKRIVSATEKLPELLRRVRRLEQALARLGGQPGDDGD